MYTGSLYAVINESFQPPPGWSKFSKEEKEKAKEINRKYGFYEPGFSCAIGGAGAAGMASAGPVGALVGSGVGLLSWIGAHKVGNWLRSKDKKNKGR